MSPVTVNASSDDLSIKPPDESAIICWAGATDEDDIRISFETNRLCSRDQNGISPATQLVRLPYPFIAVSDTCHDLVLVPSKGSFLDDFNNKTGLHIGISNGSGQVLEFNNGGFNSSNVSEKRWKQCISLGFSDSLLLEAPNLARASIERVWRQAIDRLISGKSKWSGSSYHCDDNNCFDFAIEFTRILLCLLDKEGFSDHIGALRIKMTDKTVFCHNFVLPHTRQTARYISLYRKLANSHT